MNIVDVIRTPKTERRQAARTYFLARPTPIRETPFRVWLTAAAYLAVTTPIILAVLG